MVKIFVFGQNCTQKDAQHIDGHDEERCKGDTGDLVFRKDMLVNVSCPHLKDGFYVSGGFSLLEHMETFFFQDVHNAEGRVPRIVIGYFMLIPNEGEGYEHLALRF